nr:hypothetical protein [Tanacetum cinerariifolium]
MCYPETFPPLAAVSILNNQTLSSCGATVGVAAVAGACAGAGDGAGAGAADAIAKCKPRLCPACNTKAICDAANAAASC